MIGSHLAAMGANSEADGIALFEMSPTLVGEGRIGSALSVSVALSAAFPADHVSYQWMSFGTPIAGAVGAQYTVDAADDLAELCCQVTATRGDTVQVLHSESVIARHVAPTGSATLPDEVFASYSGPETIDISTAFAGQDLSFSVMGGTGAAMDAEMGLLTLETDHGNPVVDLMVSASNSGGVWSASLKVAFEEPPQANQVLDFSAADTGLINDAHGLPPGDVSAEGIWFSTMVYFDGVEFGNKRVVGLADPAVGDVYIQIQPSASALRNGGATETLDAFDFLTLPGWYLVTSRLWRDLSGKARCQMWRNELVSAQADFGNTFDLTPFSRLGWSLTPDSTPDFGGYKLSNLAWGTGDPSAYHAAIYNGGQFVDPLFYDFDADPGAVLVGYEDGTRESTQTDPLDPDEVSADWTALGTVAWVDIVPGYAGGEFGSVSSLLTASSSAVATFSVVSTLPMGDWDAPVVDLSKVDLWVRKGFGSAAIVDATVTAEEGVATATFTLSRALFASEIVVCALDASWLYDNAQNKSGRVSEVEIENTSTQAAPAMVMGLSNDDVSFDFDQLYQGGLTADGVMWVLDPGTGVTVVNKYPLQGTGVKNGVDRVTNGTMKNPQRRSDNLQGYSSFGGFTHLERYDPALSVSFPISLGVNETLIGVRNNLEYETANGGRDGHPVNILSYQGLIVVDAVPGQNDFAPPLVGYEAGLRPSWRHVDVEAIAASLPVGYDTTGMDKPDFEVLLTRIERFHPALFQFSQVEMKREMTPSGFTKGDGYGTNFISTTGSVMLMLLSTESTLAQRVRAVRMIVHHYRQWYGLGRMSSDGGHNQGVWGFLVLGDYWANAGAGLGTLIADTGGNEQSVFQITDQAMLDIMTTPHTGGGANSDRPEFLELTEITSIDGNQITFERIDALNQDNTDTRNAARASSGQNLTRPSDGYSVAFTGHNDNRNSANFGALTVADASQLAVGDVVHISAPWEQQIGDFEWTIRAGDFSQYSASFETVYRGLNQWSAQVLAVQALGLMHPSFDPIRGYVELANTGGGPTAGNDFPTHHNTFVYADNEPASGTSQWVKQFWGLHWTLIKTVPQNF